MVNKYQKSKPETRQQSLINWIKKKKVTATPVQYQKNIRCSFKNNKTTKPDWTTKPDRAKTQQHDEILNNLNHHARNTTDTSSNINTIKHQEEQPKNLRHASIQSNGSGNSDQILAELIHEMQQVTMATENLKNASIKC